MRKAHDQGQSVFDKDCGEGVDLRMREVVKGRQASDKSPLKTAAGLMTQQRTGPSPLGAVPSLSKAATMAATPPAQHATPHEETWQGFVEATEHVY